MQQTIEGFRLSPQQIRLWHLQQHSHAYQTFCSIEITGPLYATCLYRATYAACARHEIFRTRFSGIPEIPLPLQVVGDCPLLTWRFYDLRAAEPDERQEAIKQLTRSPLEGSHLQCTLIILAEQDHIFTLSASSLLVDRSTLQNFTHELARAYEHELSGISLDEEEGLQYLQFSEWQHTLLERKDVPLVGEDQQRFIVGQEIRLPFMKDAVEIDPFTPAQYTVSLAGERWSQVSHWLEQHTYTPPVLLLSCWAALLSRMSGQQELYLAVHIDGREHTELASIAGPLEKALPLSCQIDDTLLFTDLLAQMQQRYEQLSSLYPTFSLEALLSAARRESGSWLSPLSFAYGHLPSAFEAGSLTWRIQDCVCYNEPFALRLVVLRRAGELCLQWHYHTGLFPLTAIQQIAQHFLTLLQAALSQSQSVLRHLPLLSPAQRQRLLQDFAQGPQPVPHEQDLCQLIAQQAHNHPERIAVEDRLGQLSYQALMQQVSRLAGVLRRQHIGPEQLIGVYQHRHQTMLISLLAILQTGGAYVPLDPQSPPQRLQAIVQQAGVHYLLGNQDLLPSLPALEGVEVLSVEQVLAEEPDPAGPEAWWHPEAKELEGLQDRLAYVIYTSGSTGQPKGVMISQRGLTGYVCWASQYYQVAAGTGAPVHSPLAFDLTVTSLFTPLVAGRKVVLVEESAGVEGLQRVVREQGKQSLVKLTPAHLTLLNESLTGQEKAEMCGALVIGGEALYGEQIEPWRQQEGGPRLINEYGPTETVVGCCIYEGQADRGQTGRVPIGRPITGVQVYVLDQDQQPVVAGAVGELYIGGEAVARGYLGQADLTAEQFIPHEWSEEPGKRLYRTGDVVRYRDEQGRLEYLGRGDRQVKLRGYRIELGDIECALLRHAQIQDAAVILREDELGMPQLVAYIVPHLLPTPELHELRIFLRDILPEYMIPTMLVSLPSMPLTPNGKVDLRQLHAIDARPAEGNGGESQGAAKVIVPPRDVIELQLLRLWEEALHLQNISVVDDFFELGGHSMLALRLLALILKYLEQDITLATFFLYPTIADLAVILRRKTPSVYRSPLVALQPRGSRPPFFCVHPSGGTAVHYLHLARHLGQDQPCYGLQATDQISDEDSQATIEDMAACYLDAVRAIQPHGPYLLGGWSMGGIVALEMAQQALRQGEQVALLALIDSRIASAERRAWAMAQDETLSDETFARMMAATFKIELPPDFEQLDHREVINQFFAQAKQDQRIPVDMNLEQARRIARITRKHDHMAHIYEAQAYHQRIDYFIAQDSMGQGPDSEEDQSTTQPERRGALSPWREVAQGGLEVHIIPGTHRLMIEEPNVQALALALRACIDGN